MSRRLPVTLNRLNAVLAAVRGAPLPTIEMYSRNMRKAGAFPNARRGRTMDDLPRTEAARLLFAVMRGSPTNAAANADELGSLIVCDHGGDVLSHAFTAQLKALGWTDSITLAEAVSDIIARAVAGGLSQITVEPKSLKIEVDRYWTTASISFLPTLALTEAMVEAYTKDIDRGFALSMLHLGADGLARNPVTFDFHTPLLYDIKTSYGVNPARNKQAHADFRASKLAFRGLDVHGSEHVGLMTIEAIAELYRDPTSTPVNAERLSTVTVPGASAPGQHEEEK